MAQLNQALRDAILLHAELPNGMRCADVPGYTTQAVYLIARRMAGNGLLHTAPEGRGLRYFACPAARDTWNKVQRRNAPTAAITTISTPAAKRCMAKGVVGLETAPRTVAPLPANARFADGPLRAARMPGELPFVYRPGSQDHERHPSRTGDHLIYRDGRTARVGAEG